MRFKTSMLRPDICNYSDAYIVIKRIINLEGEINRAQNKLNFKEQCFIYFFCIKN